ncbi:lipopolysaccharide biosynthesis protein [Sphingomonas sp. PR090111-T3T-6A]|uniref:lipopolysaccharide biosynthesis protein n=1 Tax=Sphingomonas sp. PR090111-T3T-6A TaxID=685778 RepID=UPI0003734534|nr:oligosaccharide flippase family protein [Sphingomonas sp. PR090111-T3T-6A]
MTPSGESAVFGRMRRNLGWLLGGRGFQAVASLFYLGFAARALGPQGFGEFTLSLAYGQAIANLAQFQSWQGVIRYGTLHLARANPRRLSRLLGLTATLDWASAIIGALVAVVALPFLAPWLHWSADQQHRAALFSVALLLSIGATPTGMLRLFDRFDLIAYAQAAGPVVRLGGVALAWVCHGDVGAFLGVWAIAALAQSLATWALALRHTDQGIGLGVRRFRIALRENIGIWRFMLVTNLSSTLSQLTEQVGTLAVGGVAGPVAAGGYRMAAKLAKAMARPVQMMAVTLFPELARLAAQKDVAVLDRVMARTLRFSAMFALLLILVVFLCGPLLLRLLSGHDYAFARPVFTLLSIGAALDLSGFALEPLLVAHGRPQRVLRIKAGASIAYFLVLIVLLPMLGYMAAAIATVGAALVTRLRLGHAARTLHG